MDYTYEPIDKPTSVKKNKEDWESDKLVRQEYLKVVIGLLKPYPCYTNERDLAMYSRKLWRTIQDEHRLFSDDQLLDFLQRAVRKSANFLARKDIEAFDGYRYILKLVRVVIGEKPDELDEGETI